jgi:site-specific DNA-cytosine methylase
MRVLIACEESQAVCIEFRKRGHEAFSCDILPCSGGHPEWHLQQDVFEVINQGWDMMIAFPPCTHLAVSGAAWFEQKRKDGRQQQGIDFFLAICNAPIRKIAVENPVGIMSKIYRKPDQIIQPYYFGDKFQKTTCLWLKNLTPLQHFARTDLFAERITHVDRGAIKEYKSGKRMPEWYADAFKLKKDERAKMRSKTFPGIARAMAEQWG